MVIEQFNLLAHRDISPTDLKLRQVSYSYLLLWRSQLHFSHVKFTTHDATPRDMVVIRERLDTF